MPWRLWYINPIVIVKVWFLIMWQWSTTIFFKWVTTDNRNHKTLQSGQDNGVFCEFVITVKCHYNACHCNANASLTRSILGSQTPPTSWHALMTVPEWLSTWAKGVKSSRSDRPQRQWHLFVPIQLEQNKRIPPAGHVKTVDSWLIFDQTHWLFISDALRMPPFGQYGC